MSDNVVIEVKDLHKEFRVGFFMRKVVALRGIDFSVKRGEVFGFLGPNGAGKTTTIKILMALLKPDKGRVNLFGESPFSKEVRRKIGYMSENPYYYDYLTANEFLELTGSLYLMNRKEIKKKVGELLEIVGLKGVENRQLRKFSKGMLQRVGFAQALLSDPELLILDEPMSGLDPIGRREMRDLILNLKEKGKTIFFSSHILSDVELICDRVAIINRGKIIAIGELESLLKSSQRIVEIEYEGVDINQLKLTEDVKVEARGNLYHITIKGEEEADRILKEIISLGGKIYSYTPHRETLEDIFMRKALASSDIGD